MVSPNARAEIAGAGLGPRPMMITSVFHAPRHPAAGPPESVRTVLVELGKVPFKLGLERLLQVVAFVQETGAKANVFLLANPSD